MSVSVILAGSLLALFSPLGGTSSRCAGPVHPFGAEVHPLATFEEAQRQLQQSVAELRQRLQQGEVDIDLRDHVRLELERLRHFPDRVANDAGVDALFTEAMLVVAASVQDCDPLFAEAWVDRALARRELGLSAIAGPELTGLPDEFIALYEQRALELSAAAPATIRLQCEIACTVFVDGHHVPVALNEVEAYPVLPGVHEIWIFHAAEAGDPTASDPTRVSVTELDLGSGDQSCLGFPNPSYVGLLPSREAWWSAWSFAQRIDWAIESKKTLVNVETSMFEALIDESPGHARVLAQAPELRELRVRVALHLADLWQQAGELDAANMLLDRVLLWADLQDARPVLAVAVGKFPGLVDPFEARVIARNAAPRGTLEIDCGRCLPVIDGVVIGADLVELPADRYRVEIYPSSAKGKVSVFEEVVIRAKQLTLLHERKPRKPDPGAEAVAAQPVDFVNGYWQNPQLQRWVWGTAGGIALVGGAVWSFALTAKVVPGIRDIGIGETITSDNFNNQRAAEAIKLGLYITGAFFLHAEIAAYLFSRIPSSRRPGIPLIAVGAGVLAFGIVTAGHAATGYASWSRAANKAERADPEAVPSDIWKYERQQQASANVGWVGSAATGVLVVGGTTLVVLGAERSRMARRNGVLRPERAPRHQQPGVVPIILGSGLMIAGTGFVGLGMAALALESPRVGATAIVGIGGGSMLALSGAVLLSVGAKRRRSSKRQSAIVPSFSPNSLGLQVVGRF